MSTNRLNGVSANGHATKRTPAKPARRRLCTQNLAGDNPAEPVIEAANRAIDYLEAQLRLAEQFGSPVKAFYRARNTFHDEHGICIAIYDDGSKEVVRKGGDA